MYSKWLNKSQMTMSSKDQSMMRGMQYLRELCDRLVIVDGTYQKACEIYKKVEDAQVARGMRMNQKCSTILFIACRMTNNQKKLEDILRATQTGHKEINKCYKRMKPVLPGANLGQSSNKYAEEAAKKLGLENEVVEVCKATAENISKLEVLTGKKPATIAGVAIFMIVCRSPVLKQKIDCGAISQILGMGEGAIKNAYREIEDLESEILPMGFQQHMKSF